MDAQHMMHLNYFQSLITITYKHFSSLTGKAATVVIEKKLNLQNKHMQKVL
jgi:hypothetical protein